MASIEERIQDNNEIDVLVCPSTPYIKPKRSIAHFEEEECFTLGDIESSRQSSQASDFAGSDLKEIFREKDSILEFLNQMKLRKRSF